MRATDVIMGLMFKRYTEPARRAIYFTRLEAQMRGEAPISVAHLLAGLTWDSDTRVERVAGLRSRSAELHGIVGLPHFPTTASPYDSKTDLPLNDDAKKTLAYAAEEAERDRQFWIDTDHVLRGILRFQNATGEALEKAGFELDQLRMASDKDRKENPPQKSPAFPLLRVLRLRYKYWIYAAVFLLLLALLIWMGPVK
ncbi:MAG TPA: Clp protease N-terminal domain-containing protein [Terriglobales bacterium]|nr:Clp protease N-terminal domain-containing protein [Terriglobales bacterium]